MRMQRVRNATQCECEGERGMVNISVSIFFFFCHFNVIRQRECYANSYAMQRNAARPTLDAAQM